MLCMPQLSACAALAHGIDDGTTRTCTEGREAAFPRKKARSESSALGVWRYKRCIESITSLQGLQWPLLAEIIKRRPFFLYPHPSLSTVLKYQSLGRLPYRRLLRDPRALQDFSTDIAPSRLNTPTWLPTRASFRRLRTQRSPT
jgi:hypothetical protein